MDFWRRKSALWLQRAACAASVECDEVSGYSRSLGVQWMMSGSSSKSNFPNIRLLLSIKKRTIASVTSLIPAGILKDLQHVEIFHGGLPVTLPSSVLQQIPQADR